MYGFGSISCSKLYQAVSFFAIEIQGSNDVCSPFLENLHLSTREIIFRKLRYFHKQIIPPLIIEVLRRQRFVCDSAQSFNDIIFKFFQHNYFINIRSSSHNMPN